LFGLRLLLDISVGPGDRGVEREIRSVDSAIFSFVHLERVTADFDAVSVCSRIDKGSPLF